MTWFRALALVLSAAVLGGCSGCGAPPLEPHPDVPVSLELVEAMADPPTTTVTVSRKQHEVNLGEVGSCRNSPFCLLVTPVQAIAAVTPPKIWDEVRVTRSGAVLLDASYTVKGELIDAALYEADRVRYYEALRLAAVDRSVVVETGRAPWSDGKTGTVEALSILAQVDLLADYRAKLAESSSPTKRSLLIVEAMRALRAESKELSLGFLGSTVEADEARARVLQEVCHDRADWLPRATWFEAAAKDPGIELAFQAFGCDGSLGGEQAPVFVAAAARAYCRGDEGHSFDPDRFRRVVPKRLVDTAIKACPDAEGRALMSMLFGRKVDSGALGRAFARGVRPTADWLELLELNKSVHRRALFAGIAGNPSERLYLKTLINAELTPSEAEGAQLAQALLARPEGRVGHEAGAMILQVLRRGADKGMKPSRAVGVLETAARSNPSSSRAATGLAVLGKPDALIPVLRELQAAPRVSSVSSAVRDERGFVGFGLHLIGCSRSQAETTWKAIREGQSVNAICPR